jgi:membrane protein
VAIGWWSRWRQRGRVQWEAVQQQHVSVRHVVAAWELLKRNNGHLYAGAITYFSFLALFPLMLLAVSVIGFVLHADPELQRSVYLHISAKLPGRAGSIVHDAVQTAIDDRSSVGLIGFVGVLVIGARWVANLRSAIDAVWGRPPRKAGFLSGQLSDLLVLVGLGLGSAISLTLTVVGTSLTRQILPLLSLDGGAATALVKVLGILLAGVGDVVIFWWLFVRLPAVEVPQRIAVRGAVLAAVGLEVLKIVGSYTIAHTARSPTYGPFAGVVAVLIWIQLVARYLLFACAWTATLTAEARPVAPAEDPPGRGSGRRSPDGSAPAVPADAGTEQQGGADENRQHEQPPSGRRRPRARLGRG